jgi:hypothetical protein
MKKAAVQGNLNGGFTFCRLTTIFGPDAQQAGSSYSSVVMTDERLSVIL